MTIPHESINSSIDDKNNAYNDNKNNDHEETLDLQRDTLSRVTTHFSPAHLTPQILNHAYPGSGTETDPYIVTYLANDPSNAQNFTKAHKWTITVLQGLTFLILTFSSSAYSSAIPQIAATFSISYEVSTLGLSLFVLGFALGPLLWATLGETIGRRIVFVGSFAAFTAFSVAGACVHNAAALMVMRFFASAFGSSAQTNSGAVVADLFVPKERGKAMMLYAMAPFLGPALGPVVGGFMAETVGWRWILGLVAIMAGVIWIATTLTMPETYAPVILRSRAKALSKQTGHHYVSRLDAGKPIQTPGQKVSVALGRPLVLLFREPVVLLTSLYMSVVYGILYMLFAAVPIVFGQTRGWSQGLAGLPFVEITIGVILATGLAGLDNVRYVRLYTRLQAKGLPVQPESRLNLAMAGSLVLPAGLFLFAWTTYPSIPWIAPVLGALMFSCGLVLIFISLISYLVDAYSVYSASVMAAGAVCRSLFATAFPLFTTQMYESLGDQWASSIPAFLAVLCVPIPFLFYKYGAQIRSKCKFASQAAKELEMMTDRPGIPSAGQPADDLEKGT